MAAASLTNPMRSAERMLGIYDWLEKERDATNNRDKTHKVSMQLEMNASTCRHVSAKHSLIGPGADRTVT